MRYPSISYLEGRVKLEANKTKLVFADHSLIPERLRGTPVPYWADPATSERTYFVNNTAVPECMRYIDILGLDPSDPDYANLRGRVEAHIDYCNKHARSTATELRDKCIKKTLETMTNRVIVYNTQQWILANPGADNTTMPTVLHFYPTAEQVDAIIKRVVLLFDTTPDNVRNIRSARGDKAMVAGQMIAPSLQNVIVEYKPRLIMPEETKNDVRYRAVELCMGRAHMRIRASDERAREKTANSRQFYMPQDHKISIFDVFPRVDRNGVLLPLDTVDYPSTAKRVYPRACPVLGSTFELQYVTTRRQKNQPAKTDIRAVCVWRLSRHLPLQPGNITIMSTLAAKLIEDTIGKSRNPLSEAGQLAWNGWSRTYGARK